MDYKFLKHTADTQFKAYGKTLTECFSNAGIAMFEVMTDIKKIKPLIKKEIKIKSEDIKALLYDFLEELLFIHETKHLFLCKFKIKVDKKKLTVTGSVYGEKINESHERRALVKAITYNNMIVGKGFVQAVLDL